MRSYVYPPGADAKRHENRVSNPYIQGKEQKLAQIIAAAVDGENPRILEIGSGEGSNLVYLSREMDGRFTGIDFSFDKSCFQKISIPKASAVCGDAATLPFASESFDLVVCRDILHHLGARQNLAVSESFRVMRFSGTLIILESDGRKLLNLIFRMLFPQERGMRESTPIKVLMLAREYGRADLQFVEASFLLRAIGFLLGWPAGKINFPRKMIYTAAQKWERLIEVLLPRRKWTYFMVSVKNRQA